MRRLWRKGLTIIGLLMVAIFSFTGCGAIDVEEFTVLGNDVTFGSWLIAAGVALLIILVIVVVIVKKRGKK